MGVVAKVRVGVQGVGRLYRTYLLTGNVISSAVLMSFGDYIEQYHQRRPKSLIDIDWARNLRLTITGAGMGLINHYYYGFIDKLFPTAAYKHVVTKVIADQLLASPICITFLFYCDGALLGLDHDEIKEDLRSKFSTVYIADCSIWPPLQFINFRFVSNRYRVLFLNTAQMFYNILLSHLKYYDSGDGSMTTYTPVEYSKNESKERLTKKEIRSKKPTDPRDKLGTRFTKVGEK